MSAAERVFNLLLAASVLSWAVLGLHHSGLTLTRASITGLHLCVAFLLVFRGPRRVAASTKSLLVCLPALLIGGWALHLANQGELWPWYAQAVFTTGTVLAIFTFMSLGKSFSIMPALRKLVTNGPFRFVRHPAYLGELSMILGCSLASSSTYALLPFALALPLVALRIVEEEKLLGLHPGYRRYQQAVPWRLVPKLW